MRTIYKYEIEITDRFTIDMPRNATPFACQVQQGKPQMWAIVNPEAPIVPKHFRLIGTGHPILNPNDLRYIGTFPMSEVKLVWHLFEETETHTMIESLTPD